MKVITSFRTLCQYVHALGEARRSGDPERIARAEAEHDAYRKACIEADEMHLGLTVGELRDTQYGKGTRS